MADRKTGSNAIPILLTLLSMTLVFEAMLFVTGRITVEEGLVALGLRESDAEIVASLRDETLQSSELLIQWDSLLNQRDLLREEKRELLAIEARIEIDRETSLNERGLVENLMAALTDTLSARRGAEIAKLAKLYDSMKPVDAARVLRGLDLGLAAEVLARLKPRQSAKILAALDPSRAVELSTLLSGAKPPKSVRVKGMADGG
ncbi:MAG: hypothetical protein CME06_03585 [Gemmatimonadetes bacterium]|nr:hypothetical protein [Gemmatimonadota bacterium]